MSRIEIEYKEACRNYTFGFACALFMCASSVAYVLLLVYKESLSIGDWLFIFLFDVGLFVFFMAWKYPISFYELVENK